MALHSAISSRGSGSQGLHAHSPRAALAMGNSLVIWRLCGFLWLRTETECGLGAGFFLGLKGNVSASVGLRLKIPGGFSSFSI
jgi:hypothetical protein